MQFKVNNSEIEGQHPLTKVSPVVLLKLRVVLAVILSLATGLLFALFLRWSNKLYNRFLFEPCHEAVATHYLVTTKNGQEFTCRKRVSCKTYFTFRLLHYTFDNPTQCYQAMEYDTEGRNMQAILEGRDVYTKEQKLTYFGNCQLQIPIEPIYTYFFNELTGPFNFLQYFAVGIWLAQGTILFPIILLIFTVVALTINYLLYIRSRYLLQQLANIHQTVTIKNGDLFKDINGADLLPGDILVLKEGQQMNCDCAITQGDVMVNEATLTGESIPIPKGVVPNMQEIFGWEKFQQHTLYEGTKLVKCNSTLTNLAIVLRTGFTSLRGQYFRNVLYPAPPSQWFYVQAAKYIIELALIVLVVQFILLKQWFDLNYSSKLIILRFLDTIVWSIPPSLPIFFSICKTASLVRLGTKGIMGSNADKVESAGRIDTCCFDKTGTLTTLGLKALKHFTADQLMEPMANIIMACCHHLVKIHNEITGDPLEVEMFNHVKWQIDFEDKGHFSVTDGKQTFDIEKIFEFSSARQMMSVIAFNGSKYYLLTKGSTEMVSTMSVNKGVEIQSEMHQYASKGFRVIGLGYRELTKEQINLQREQLEKDLQFIGLFILENSLKPDTPEVIAILKQANMDIKIISGDNPLTTMHCAKVAGIIEESKEIRLLDINQTTSVITLQGEPEVNIVQDVYSRNVDTIQRALAQDSNLAITGKLLEYLSKFNNLEITNQNFSTSHNQTNQIFTENNQLELDDTKMVELLLKVVARVRVFARQKPEQKKEIVSLLQQQGRQVMMVGDGANDCSAIAQAQIGISFSESDASYTAPFSSKSTSIMCAVKVLSQGKAAIMTIIEVFQYQLSVNIVKFVTVAIMGLEGQSFSDFQFVYIGYMSSLPFLLFLTWSSPCEELCPYIPLDDQFIYQNQLAMYNQMLTSTLGLMINTIIIKNIDGRVVDLPDEITSYTREGLLNSVMFLGCLFYFMTMGISIYVSNPFKVKFYSNYPLMVWTVLCSVIAIVTIIFSETGSWVDVQKITDETYKGFNWVVLAVMSGTALLGYFNQTLLQKYLPTSIKIQHNSK